jgi:hypothetical protein
MIATESGPAGEDIPVGELCDHCARPVRAVGVSWLFVGRRSLYFHPACAHIVGRYLVGDAEAIERACPGYLAQRPWLTGARA